MSASYVTMVEAGARINISKFCHWHYVADVSISMPGSAREEKRREEKRRDVHAGAVLSMVTRHTTMPPLIAFEGL
jgi:hypothetical protein